MYSFVPNYSGSGGGGGGVAGVVGVWRGVNFHFFDFF